jgi:hypothetical protein
MEPVFLNKEVDKSGSHINIMQVESIAHSPVYTFFIRHIAELIDSGHALAKTSWNDDECGAVYAEKNGEILGAIIYSTAYLKKKSLWIELSAVAKEHRKKGVYTILHPYFEMIAKGLNCDTISSRVHMNNTVRLKSAEKVGMKLLFYQMIKVI